MLQEMRDAIANNRKELVINIEGTDGIAVSCKVDQITVDKDITYNQGVAGQESAHADRLTFTFKTENVGMEMEAPKGDYE